MRVFLLWVISVGIAVSAVAQMAMQPSAESDALFAAGVDLYNAGKYHEAIPLFVKSDSLDKAQIASSSNRRSYSSMWLASCYYKLGDAETANRYSFYYQSKPIDRRLTFKSDSLAVNVLHLLMLENYDEAYPLLKICADIETEICGATHPFILNTLSMCRCVVSKLRTP